MNKIELLEREINYQLVVYKGKTKKYVELQEKLEFYKCIYLINYLKVKYKHLIF